MYPNTVVCLDYCWLVLLKPSSEPFLMAYYGICMYMPPICGPFDGDSSLGANRCFPLDLLDLLSSTRGLTAAPDSRVAKGQDN